MTASTPPIHVTLLTKPQCGYCDDAKALLQRLGGEFHLAVETVDIQTPLGEQLARDSNVLFPPGLLLDGAPFSYGRVSERKLRRELERQIRLQADNQPIATTTPSRAR
jgi:glutaredoxin